MRWFKHLSMAHADAGLSTLVEELGPEAYGIYWLLLEHFASSMEKDCAEVPALIHSETRWAEICHCSTRRFRTFSDRASNLRLICVESASELRQYCGKRVANRLQISIPKLLKYRDEYSRKSGVTPDKLPARSDTDKIQNIEPPIVPLGGPVPVPDPPRKPKPQMTAEQRAWFADWWGFYPRHVAKLEAEKAWGRHVRDPQTADAAIAGLKVQLPDFASRERDKIPHPATWINQHRWTDEIFLPLAYPVGGVLPIQFEKTKTMDELFPR